MIRELVGRGGGKGKFKDRNKRDGEEICGEDNVEEEVNRAADKGGKKGKGESEGRNSLNKGQAEKIRTNGEIRRGEGGKGRGSNKGKVEDLGKRIKEMEGKVEMREREEKGR
ncbi:hypothetical protein KM043_014479 [Ampulex compressa]|nr:hypothetical protein KM043_014479 [Ampulex compressa]